MKNIFSHSMTLLGNSRDKETCLNASGAHETSRSCEAGIPAMALGGICGALPNGKLLPDLWRILEKRGIKRLLFIGDADTTFNAQFTREAAKIARALPEGCQLVLPRSLLTL